MLRVDLSEVVWNANDVGLPRKMTRRTHDYIKVSQTFARVTIGTPVVYIQA